jgi:hypothetical protein
MKEITAKECFRVEEHSLRETGQSTREIFLMDSDTVKENGLDFITQENHPTDIKANSQMGR